MNRSEEHAQRYLQHLGLKGIRYEPDGNQPPDFATDDSIAVEVRRLNQHFEHGGDHVALEHDAYPTVNGMNRLLASFGESKNDRSWWVHCRFRRPMPKWKELEPDVRTVLSEINSSGGAPDDPVWVHRSLTLQIVPCDEPENRLFVFAGYTDHNAGGWVLHELQQNIQLCVDEKMRKVAPFRASYARWWLILVDHTGLGTHGQQRAALQQHVRVRHDWDRVAILNPKDYRDAVIIDAATPTA